MRSVRVYLVVYVSVLFGICGTPAFVCVGGLRCGLSTGRLTLLVLLLLMVSWWAAAAAGGPG